MLSCDWAIVFFQQVFGPPGHTMVPVWQNWIHEYAGARETIQVDSSNTFFYRKGVVPIQLLPSHLYYHLNSFGWLNFNQVLLDLNFISKFKKKSYV